MGPKHLVYWLDLINAHIKSSYIYGKNQNFHETLLTPQHDDVLLVDPKGQISKLLASRN
jgi:hypothetical protein